MAAPIGLPTPPLGSQIQALKMALQELKDQVSNLTSLKAPKTDVNRVLSISGIVGANAKGRLWARGGAAPRSNPRTVRRLVRWYCEAQVEGLRGLFVKAHDARPRGTEFASRMGRV